MTSLETQLAANLWRRGMAVGTPLRLTDVLKAELYARREQRRQVEAYRRQFNELLAKEPTL